MATHLFTARAASGIWRPRDSCSTEAALRLMRRMVLAAHLFTSHAAPGIWRSRDSCSTVVALSMQPVATLQTSWNFCRSDATMKEARWGNSRVVSLFEVFCATPPPLCLGRKRGDVANLSPQSVYILPPVSSFFMQLVWTSSGVRQCSALSLPLPSLTHTSVLTCTFSSPFLVFLFSLSDRLRDKALSLSLSHFRRDCSKFLFWASVTARKRRRMCLPADSGTQSVIPLFHHHVPCTHAFVYYRKERYTHRRGGI